MTATGSSPSSARISGQISVRQATRTGGVANSRTSPVLSVSDTGDGVAVGDPGAARGVGVASGIAVAAAITGVLSFGETAEGVVAGASGVAAGD